MMNDMDFGNPSMNARSNNQETNSANTSSQSPRLELHPGFGEANQPARAGSLCAASQRHIRTEQKRRDRINDGFVALQALLPGKEKVEKAVMLTQAADYIRQLQGLMQEVLACGASKSLPNELQWNLRMLLPRKSAVTTKISTETQPPPPPAPYQQDPSNNNVNNNGAAQMMPAVQAPAPVINPAPIVTTPMMQGPQYGLQYSQPQAQGMNMGNNMGINIAQGQIALSEPAAGGGGGMNQGGMLIADPATLSHLQALMQQQQAVQGWHNASHLLQALHMQQQLQQTSSGGPVGITVTPQMLQQLAGNQAPAQMYQQQGPSQVSMGVPVTSGIPVSAMPTSMPQAPVITAPPPSLAPQQAQGITQFPQAPQSNSGFQPAATSAFSTLPFPANTSAFSPAGGTSLSGLHKLMEAANASDEERDMGGSFMRSPKRPRCYSTGAPKMAKAGILV